MIREALAKIKDAVATKDLIPFMTHYFVHNGFVYATNDRLTAATPFPDSRTYMVPAKVFETSLGKMPSDNIDLDISDSGDYLQVKCGRYRSKIKLYANTADMALWWSPPDGEELPVPQGFTEKLKAVRPFISDNATQFFALHVLLTDEYMAATNNISVVAAFDTGLPTGTYLMLPIWLVDFVLGRDMAPVSMQYSDRAVAFKWLDGSWVKAKLADIRFPEMVRGLIENAPQPEWEVTSEWRDVYNDVSSLAQANLGEESAEVRFYADHITGGHKHGSFSADIVTLVPPGCEYSAWNPLFLDAVIKASTHFDPTYWPNPCPFVGGLIAGVVQGMRGNR